MTQVFNTVASTDTLSASRQVLLDRDNAAASCFSGTAFPTTNLLVGMKCFRTDLNKIYTLKDTTPTWIEEIDVAGATGLAPRATALATARAFSLTGDVTASGVNFDGTGAVALSTTLSTTGVTAGTYTKVTVDAKGRVTAATTLVNADIPSVLDANARSAVRVNSAADTGTRRRLNFIPGSNATISAADASASEEVQITVGVVAAPSFSNVNNAGGGSTVSISNTGTNGDVIKMTGNGATTPNKYISILSGVFRIVNSAYTSALMTLDDSGNLTATANVTAYSDERTKTNWRSLDKGFLKNLTEIKAGIYDRIDNDMTQVGVSAQDLQKILPTAVHEDGEGMLSVAYGNAALVAAVELAKEVQRLHVEIETLKASAK